MKKINILMFLIFSFILTGCVARTYPLTRDRVDQNMTGGNRGYISGVGPIQDKARKDQRTVRVFEIELGKPYKANCSTSNPAITQEYTPVSSETNYTQDYSMPEETTKTMSSGAFEKYTVGKNDTLQKISQKFYGTTRNWPKIYEANRDILKTPDRVYSGQILNIPVEGVSKYSKDLKEPMENLK